jgi:hypothetical protein
VAGISEAAMAVPVTVTVTVTVTTCRTCRIAISMG